MKWVKDNLDGYLNFYSVSGDGEREPRLPEHLTCRESDHLDHREDYAVVE